MMSRRLSVFLVALAVSSLAFAEDVDPAGRVARLSNIQGNVSFQADDAQAPEQAELNRPVTSGDRVLTESESRAELSVGTAAIRLDERTDLSVSNLDEDIAQLEVNSGAVSIHLRELEKGETFEIDTPNATVRLLEPGDYRVDVDSDGSSTLAVRGGDAQIDSGAGPVNVHDQQQARLSSQDRYADVTVLGTPDAFDDWSMERERSLQDTQAERYVSREVVGYEDLDRYGEWHSEPEYGEVWAPSVVSVGWAPYTYGRWVWVGAYGWTWVDSAPWGFAPFHYGRWAHVRDRWCWVPGPRHHRPIYAPALVGWTDHRRDHYNRHERPLGWVPLGPREVYVPGRHVSPRYLRNVNVGNAHIDDNTRITNAWRNRSRDFNYVNRNAPGVRPVNNGLGLAGNGQPQNGPEDRSQGGRGPRDVVGGNNGATTGNVWRTGPGWRTGPSQGGLVAGDRNDDRRDSDRRDNDRRDNNRDWRNRRDNDANNPNWADNPSIGRGPIVGDGRMTIPRSPTGSNQNESQRDRTRREASDAARGYDRRLSTIDGSANDRSWRQRQQNEQIDRARRETSRSWNNGSSNRAPDRSNSPQRSYGGGQRSYGGATMGNGNQQQSRPMPSPRMEQRPVQRPQQAQPSRPQQSGGGGNRGGEPFRGGRNNQRQ